MEAQNVAALPPVLLDDLISKSGSPTIESICKNIASNAMCRKAVDTGVKEAAKCKSPDYIGPSAEQIIRTHLLDALQSDAF